MLRRDTALSANAQDEVLRPRRFQCMHFAGFKGLRDVDSVNVGTQSPAGWNDFDA
jgi:hypothetical protein